MICSEPTHAASRISPVASIGAVRVAVRLETDTFARHIGIEFTEVGPDFLAGRMRLESRMKQPFGILHGGASAALAETLGSVAANFVVDQSKLRCVGQSITANHLRPVPVDGRFVTAIARATHIDAHRQVWDIQLRREDGKVFCVSTLTMAVVPHAGA
jgi:1,4-dihydroxy-2-naphthoyl-CoA hydrolase